MGMTEQEAILMEVGVVADHIGWQCRTAKEPGVQRARGAIRQWTMASPFPEAEW